MQAFAQTHGLQYLSTPGDHIGAPMAHALEAQKGLREFFDGAPSKRAFRRFSLHNMRQI